MARTSSGKGSAAMKTTREDREVQLMRACDFDTEQMEQAEFFLATIMDARAAQDAFDDLDERETQTLSPSADSEGDGVGSPISGTMEEEVAEASSSAEEVPSESPPATPVTSSSSPAPALPVSPLTLSIVESDECRPVQWDLISPWSETEEDDAEEAELSSPEPPTSHVFCRQDGSDDREEKDEDAISVAEPDSEAMMEERLRELVESENAMALEAKLSRGAFVADPDEDFTRDIDIDEDDEEFEIYNVNMLAKEIGCIEELFEEKLDSTATDEDDNEDCTDGTRTSVATTLDDSCEESPRASSSAAASRLGRRFRANTYTGAASTYVRNGCAMIRLRTLSSTSSFRNSSQPSTSEMEGDVDFSSDDEGYSKDRVSGMSGGSRYSLRSRLSSVGGSFKVPANMRFLRFRTSSATTTTSEDSFCNDSSYACSPRSSKGETQSAPSFSSIEASQQQQEQQQNSHHQMQALKLKASALSSKAAGYLNAASAEAARKLKSKAFRNAKAVASETDEEADALPSPPSCLVHDGA